MSLTYNSQDMVGGGVSIPSFMSARAIQARGVPVVGSEYIWSVQNQRKSSKPSYRNRGKHAVLRRTSREERKEEEQEKERTIR